MAGRRREIIKKLIIFFVLIAFLLVCSLFAFVRKSACSEKGKQTKGIEISMAVEFNDHAACAFIARDKGWFAKEGLNVAAFESYTTGTALAAALAREDIQVAYICLVPAIHAYANARVPLKIIAGTHKYGYGLVANPDKIKVVKDLGKSGIRIGCVREGGSADVLLHKVLEKYGLEKDMLLDSVRRMNPPKQVLAIKAGQLDAAFLPEHWATMAETYGFTMLITAKEVWPHMQGSVLVVKDDLLRNDPGLIQRLVKVTQQATDWIIKNPSEAATVVAGQLSVTVHKAFPIQPTESGANLDITPQILFRSMARLEYSPHIDPSTVQETIDYLVHMGTIKRAFNADDIMDLRFIE